MKKSKKKLIDNIDLKDIMEVIGGLVVVLDAKGRIKSINQIGAKELGYNSDKLINKNWFDLVIAEDDKKELKSVFNRLMRGSIKNTEYYQNDILTKSRKKLSYSWHNALIKDNAGNIIGTISFGDNITKHVNFEKDLKNKNKELKKFNKLMIDRELKMIELKKKIKKLQQ